MNHFKEKPDPRSGQKQKSKISEDLEEAKNILRNLEKGSKKHAQESSKSSKSDRRKPNLVEQIFGTVFCDKEVQADFQLEEPSVAEYERRIAVLQSDLDKARIDNIKASKEKKKLQEKLSKLGSENNTSSSFMLPSEFKTRWEFLVKDQIPSFFIDFCENPYLYSALAQLLLVITSGAALEEIHEKHAKALAVFGLEKTKSAEEVMKYMRRLYQDYSSDMFFLNKKSPQVQKILELFKARAEVFIKRLFSSEKALLVGETSEAVFLEYLQTMLESEDCVSAVPGLYNLFVYFHLCETPLTFYPEINKAGDNWEPQFVICKKTEVLCMEGFLKEDSVGCIAVPGINRNKTSFLAIKPGIIVLPENLVTQAIKEKAVDLRKINKKDSESKLPDGAEKEESLTNQSVFEEPESRGDADALTTQQSGAVPQNDADGQGRSEQLSARVVENAPQTELFTKKQEDKQQSTKPLGSIRPEISNNFPRANSVSAAGNGLFHLENSSKTPERGEKPTQLCILQDLQKALYSSLHKAHHQQNHEESRRTPKKERNNYSHSQCLSNQTNVSGNYSPFDRSHNSTSVIDKEISNLFRESNRKIVGEGVPRAERSYEQQINYSGGKKGLGQLQQKILASSLHNNYIASSDNKFNYAQFFRSCNQIKEFAGEVKRGSFHEKSDFSMERSKGTGSPNPVELKGRDAEGYEVYENRGEKKIQNIKCETDRSSQSASQQKRKHLIGEDKVESKRLELSEAISSLKKSIELLKSSRVAANESTTKQRLDANRKTNKLTETNFSNVDSRWQHARAEQEVDKRKQANASPSQTKGKKHISGDSLRLDEVKINSFLQSVGGKNHKASENSSSLYQKGF